jgi:hypothetical protein
MLTQIETRSRIEKIIKAKYNFKCELKDIPVCFSYHHYPENDEEDKFLADLIYLRLTAIQSSPYLSKEEMLKLNELWKRYK